MANFCPRCGYYTDPAGTFCCGCGGKIETLRANYPVADPISSYLGADYVAPSAPAPRAAAPAPTAAAPPPVPTESDELDLSAVGAPTPPMSGVDPSLDLSGDFAADLSAPGLSGDDFSADLSADLSGELGADFSADLGGDLGADLGGGLGGDLNADLGGGLGGDLGADFSADLGADLGGGLDAGLSGEISNEFSTDFSGELSADLSGELSASGEIGGVDFTGLDLGLGGDGGPASSGELDFSALESSPASAPGSDVFDLDAGLDASFDNGPSMDLSFQTSGPAEDAGSVPTLSFDPSAVAGASGLSATPAASEPLDLGGGEGGGDGVYDLDAQLGGGFSAEPASGEIDFSALSADSGLVDGSGEVDFSNLSTLENSQSGDSAGEALDLSLSNFGGGLGELDFSSLVQDASGVGGGSGAADAIDFSGLSSIDIAPPLTQSSPGSGSGAASDDIVYDLDLDLGGDGGGAPSGFGLDDKSMSAMEDDLLKASIISYKPNKE